MREITTWLETKNWGRCVYHCDNDAVDHQTLNLNFENNVTCTLTMTAFESGRFWDIYGTRGILKVHHIHDDNPDLKIIIKEHHTGRETIYPITAPDGGYRFHHEGGDEGLAAALYTEMTRPAEEGRSSITKSLQSHLMAFAAEKSRQEKRSVELSEFTA